MNGGDGTYSYTKNSTWQRSGASSVKDATKEAVMENLEIDKLLCGSTRFAVADLGCSVGPNTFHAMETIIKAVQHKCCNSNLEFQVLFNDQIGNDFNTLFASLPHGRNYFAAAVAGSFYGRLFPSSSIHIAYSSSTLNWLSKVPEGVTEESSPAWNAGRIHYSGAPDAVVKAYEEKFEEDMKNFLRCRAQEIAAGGMIVILMASVPNRDVQQRAAMPFTFIESILIDMVKEGVVEQEQVDSFNIPTIFPCIETMSRVVEQNGSFESVKMEMVDGVAHAEAESVIMHLRAAMEMTIANHFGNGIVEQLFSRAMQRKLHFTQIFIYSWYLCCAQAQINTSLIVKMETRMARRGAMETSGTALHMFGSAGYSLLCSSATNSPTNSSSISKSTCTIDFYLIYACHCHKNIIIKQAYCYI